MAGNGKEKAQYFGFLVYQESAPADWKEQLKASHEAFAISPLHEPDDEAKKPHWHVIHYHGAPVTAESALRAIPAGVPANGRIELIHAPRNYQRYLIHLDDPEKQQFPQGAKAIETLNNFPLDLSRDFSASERREQRARIWEIIRENEITEYWELTDYLFDLDPDLYDYAANHTLFFDRALASRRRSLEG